MTQKLLTSYVVANGESVTVTVVPLHIQNEATFSLNGTQLQPTQDDPDTYEFQITGIPNSISVLSFDGVFPVGSDPAAEYDLSLCGDQGGGTFSGLIGLNNGGVAEIDIRFRVA